MFNRFKTLIGLLIIIIVCFGFQCNKSFDCHNQVYSFEIGIKAYPDKDSINVDDTLWLEINEPTTFKDGFSGQMIDYNGTANLGSAIGFIELLGNSNSSECANNFDFILVKGSSVKNSNTNLIREYSFVELNSSYVFKLGVKPKKSGIYRISVSSAENVYRQSDKCTKASFKINFKLTNQHLYYNEQNFGVIVPLPNNGYCFKVN